MKKLFSLALFVFILSGWTTAAQAKVFNVSKESFAAYVAGTWGPSFENSLSSKSNTSASVPITVDANHRYNLSGEFGFLYARPSANLRIGLEVLHPVDIKEQSATNSSGASLYTVTNEISVLIPKVDLEISLKHWSDVRLFLIAGAGYGNLAARNAYSFTSAGSSTYSLANFDEDLRGNAPMYEGALGLEGLLSDMTTWVIQAGYRNLKFDQIKHNRDATTFQGSVVKGDPATNMDGSNRTLDLSNYYVGISFRFWLH